jgi:hypothetical protein
MNMGMTRNYPDNYGALPVTKVGLRLTSAATLTSDRILLVGGPGGHFLTRKEHGACSD